VDIIASYRYENGTECIKFYAYDYDTSIFKEDISFNQISYEKGNYIKNLITQDINNDESMDFIVTVHNTITTKTTTEIYLSNPNTSGYTKVFSKSDSGIFLADLNGDN
jgi:hypothetical protein